jgi:hypothetical protein
MKFKSLLLTFLAVVATTFVVNAQKKKKIKLETSQDSVSYAIGTLFGSNLHNYGFDHLNMKVFTRAIEDAIKAQDTVIRPEQANELVQKAAASLCRPGPPSRRPPG